MRLVVELLERRVSCVPLDESYTSCTWSVMRRSVLLGSVIPTKMGMMMMVKIEGKSAAR